MAGETSVKYQWWLSNLLFNINYWNTIVLSLNVYCYITKTRDYVYGIWQNTVLDIKSHLRVYWCSTSRIVIAMIRLLILHLVADGWMDIHRELRMAQLAAQWGEWFHGNLNIKHGRLQGASHEIIIAAFWDTCMMKYLATIFIYWF